LSEFNSSLLEVKSMRARRRTPQQTFRYINQVSPHPQFLPHAVAILTAIRRHSLFALGDPLHSPSPALIKFDLRPLFPGSCRVQISLRNLPLFWDPLVLPIFTLARTSPRMYRLAWRIYQGSWMPQVGYLGRSSIASQCLCASGFYVESEEGGKARMWILALGGSSLRGRCNPRFGFRLLYVISYRSGEICSTVQKGLALYTIRAHAQLSWRLVTAFSIQDVSLDSTSPSSPTCSIASMHTPSQLVIVDTIP